MDSLQAAKWEMVEAGGRTAQSFGLNRLFGQIYVLLYLSDEAQSLDSLAQQLGVSKASVSIACRQLESWGALHRSWVKGDRKDYYVATEEFGRIVRKALLDMMAAELAKGGRIEIRGFGSFSLHYRAPRKGRNPKTGDTVALSGKHVPHFKPGKELRERVYDAVPLADV